MSLNRKFIGHGIGLRTEHFSDMLAAPPPVDWLEITSENFMDVGGRPRAVLEKARRDVPIVMHGVSMSIGSTDSLDRSYLASLKRLADRLEPAWISDHLCWTGLGGHNAHDLLPVPFTEESLAHIASRVREVQDHLGRQILLENASSYVAYKQSRFTEWEFLAALAERADCGILLDVNNVYVSAFNHGFDAHEYLRSIPVDRVGQIHLAGHSDHGAYLLDTHDALVPDPVWALYRETVARFGRVSTLVEWDDHVPSLDVVVGESRKAAAIDAELTLKEAA